MSDTSHLIDAIRDMLLDCGLFDTLDRSDVQTAAGYFNLNRINEGTAIFSEGDAGTFMCILVQGSVSIRKSNASGDEVEVTRLRRGRAFGEMAVLDGERRSASCVATCDCVLLSLGKDALDKMLQESPRTAAQVIRAIAVGMSRRLRMADGRLVNQP
ncbi:MULTISPECIES: Crp/Fnr family transcriptional regulator [Pseudomonas]|uniref:Cyclic nucleotide-binding protein n=1 Tax=Ectopseudomonas oleovorans TaxID=301 RepID=A0A653B9X0_ECTOL|nr:MULTISPECIES: cyclic nucleotide-binding domain-containing protein [Pseudomonas]QTS88398.1 cyclic nucleotide-binding domain-containing protein [Pseudomonas khazarica]TNF15305.1 MAG: cyclic nucleotide-binding domain-containing protein [Pseudomonadales bacterium]WFC62114.1 cyclic nucleotide-binding domain-containing protein [Pseudomonas sp. REST10]CAE6914114.1 Cyclic nucleotide-binding protein [Pseudomonas oleovorans]